MNCAEKLLEPTIFFNLYTKSDISLTFTVAMVSKMAAKIGWK